MVIMRLELVRIFSSLSRDRRDAISYNICSTCLDPLGCCRAITGSQRCGNEVSFRPVACKECRDSNNTEDMLCTNALICYDKSHTKMSKAEMLKIAPHVFPGFSKASSEALVMSWTDCRPLESPGQTYFDTVTGKRKIAAPDKKNSDPGERALHILQKLKLGKVEFLVMLT